MRPLTLERRVMAWSAALVAISLLVCGGGGAIFLYAQAVADLDAQARGLAGDFFQHVREHGGDHFNWGDRHEVEEWLPGALQNELVELRRNGEIYSRSVKLGDALLPSAATPQFIQLPQGMMRVASFSEMGAGLVVAVPAGRIGRLVRGLAVIFAAGFPVMLAFVVLGGRWIAKQALRPVRRIADEAEGITSQLLFRRVSVPPADDEIRRLALVLNATLDRLEASFQQAMRFSADASHELKTPLTVLHGDIEALLNSPTLSDSDRAAVADIFETAKRLNSITKSLLLLAQTDAGRLKLDLRPVDFARVLDDCVYDARIMAEARGLTLEADIPKKAVVLGEEVRLSQIAGNLLDNAVKYNQPGGRIRVSLKPDAGLWVLEISNTGPGIPPEQASRIFERFHRGSHHADISGHGLGLSLCSELARAHGAAITLVRFNPEWTVFRFALPRSQDSVHVCSDELPGPLDSPVHPPGN